MGFLEFLEQTAIATFIRESSSYFGFPTVLFLHTLGLSFLVGANLVVSMRVLGLAPGLPLQPLRRLFPFMWLGFVLTVLSGTGLAMAAATTRLLNPILLVKLVLVAIATVIMRRLEKKVFNPKVPKTGETGEGKAMAAALLVLWLAVTTAGRLIAYSATIFGG
jgi:hypothetical protein